MFNINMTSQERKYAKNLREADRATFNKFYWSTRYNSSFEVQLSARTMCRWMNAKGYNTRTGLGVH